MTQQDKLTELLKEFGIPFKLNELDSELSIEVVVDHKTVGGYTDFSYEFIFDENGNFKEHNIWE